MGGRGKSSGGGGGRRRAAGGGAASQCVLRRRVMAIPPLVSTDARKVPAPAASAERSQAAPNSCMAAAAMHKSRRSWPLRAISIRPTGSAAGSGSEMAHRSKKLTIAVLRSTATLRAAKDLGILDFGDGRRDDRGRWHDQHVERRQAAHPWRGPAARVRASCRHSRPARRRSRARCARGHSDRYRRRAAAAGRDGWRRPPAARCRPWH